jgi:hypothetical protein
MLDVNPHVRGARAATAPRWSARTWPSEVALVWAIVIAVAAAALLTYWRLPAGATYHFADTGPGGGLSRVASYLSYPVALIGIGAGGLVAVSRTASMRLRTAAVVSIALCASVPLVVSQSDLTARWGDAVPVAGVILAGAVSAAAARAASRAPDAITRGDRVRIALGALLVVAAVPWVAAALGFYISDAPVLGAFLRARQPTPGNALLPTIHRGLHDGLFGCQLAVSALLLSRALRRIEPGRLRTMLSLYLGLMLVYGIAIAAADGWDEQLVKRGVTSISLPDVLNPSLSLAWACVLLAAVAVHVGWFGRQRPG